MKSLARRIILFRRSVSIGIVTVIAERPPESAAKTMVPESAIGAGRRRCGPVALRIVPPGEKSVATGNARTPPRSLLLLRVVSAILVIPPAFPNRSVQTGGGVVTVVGVRIII